MSELSTTGTIDRRKSPPAPGDAYDRPQWRTWLLVMLSLSVSFSAALYAVVVLVDPFSTGRFALTHRVDFATSNTRLANAGLVRDTQFDATIIGDSTAYDGRVELGIPNQAGIRQQTC